MKLSILILIFAVILAVSVKCDSTTFGIKNYSQYNSIQDQPSTSTDLSEVTAPTRVCKNMSVIQEEEKLKLKELEVELEQKLKIPDDKIENLYEEKSLIWSKIFELENIESNKERAISDRYYESISLPGSKWYTLEAYSVGYQKALHKKREEYLNTTRKCEHEKFENFDDEAFKTCMTKIATLKEDINKFKDLSLIKLQEIEAMNDKQNKKWVEFELELKTDDLDLYVENRKKVTLEKLKISNLESQISVLTNETYLIRDSYYEKINQIDLETTKIMHEEIKYCAELNWKHGIEIEGLKWSPLDKSIPHNAILGGKDLDGTELYIVRSNVSNKFAYGKIKNNTQLEVFLTNDRFEFRHESQNVDILIANSYLWCNIWKAHNFRVNDEFPMCRAVHRGVQTPGTLLSKEECRIGFNNYAHTYRYDSFEVLKFEKC